MEAELDAAEQDYFHSKLMSLPATRGDAAQITTSCRELNAITALGAEAFIMFWSRYNKARNSDLAKNPTFNMQHKAAHRGSRDAPSHY